MWPNVESRGWVRWPERERRHALAWSGSRCSALLRLLVAGLGGWRLEPLRPVRDLVVPATRRPGRRAPPRPPSCCRASLSPAARPVADPRGAAGGRLADPGPGAPRPGGRARRPRPRPARGGAGRGPGRRRPVVRHGQPAGDPGVDHEAAHRDRRARAARPATTSSPPGSSRGAAGRVVLVGGGDPYLASRGPAGRARRDLPAARRRRHPRPRRRRRRCGRRACAGSGSGTTPRCSPGPRPRPAGSPTTSPTTSCRRSPRCGWTRGARPAATTA